MIQVVTTLVSMTNTAIVDSNIDAALCPLTDHEQEVKEYLEKKVFGDLTHRHWEGKELISYWNAVKQS